MLMLILAATVCYALFDFFAAQSSGRIDANLSSVVFNGLATVIPLAVYGIARLTESKHPVTTQPSGLVSSTLAGVSIAVFSVLLVKVFERGSLAYVMPLVYGGAIILASLLGYFIRRENIGRAHLAGLLLVVLGIAIVAASSGNPS